MSHGLFRCRALARLAAFCLGTSALVATPALAQVIDYPNGTNSNSPIVLTNNTTQLQVLTGSATQSGVISESGGSFGLEKIGAGTLIFSAQNTYTGVTTISNGTLQIGNGSSTGTVAGNIVNNGSLVFDGASAGYFVTGAISGAGSVTLMSGNTTFTAANTYGGGTTINSGAALAIGGSFGAVQGNILDNGTLSVYRGFDGAISGSGTVEIKPYVSPAILSGSNTYSGATVIDADATLVVTGSIAQSTIDVPSFAVLGGTGTVGNTIIENGASLSPGSASGAVGTLTVTGGLTLNSGSNYAVDVNPSSADKTSVIGSVTINNSRLSITPAAGTYSPATYVLLSSSGALTGSFSGINYYGSFSAGIVPFVTQDANDVYLTLSQEKNWLASPVSNVFGDGGNWDAGAAPGSGETGVMAASSVTTINVNGSTTVGGLRFPLGYPRYTFNINGSGSTGLVFNNTGITDPQFTSPIFNVVSGSLTFTGFATSNDATINVSPGAVLYYSGYASMGQFEFANGPGGIMDVGGIVGQNFYVGQLGTIGTIDLGGKTLNITGGVNYAGTIVDDSLSNGTQPSSVHISGGGVRFTGANTYTGGTTIDSNGTLRLGNGGTTGSILGDVIDNGVLSFERSDSLNFTGTISGSGQLIQNGAGTTVFTGSNTYAGGTTISAGTLQVGNGGTTGNISAANVTDNGTLAFDRSDTVTFSNVISGTGNLTQMGTGTLILTGANTYSGLTTINSGATLQVGNNTPTGSLGSGNVINNGTLTFHNDNYSTVANAISGSGNVNFTGAVYFLTGNSTYTGGTTISAGAIQIGLGGTTGSIIGNVIDDDALTFNRSDSITFAGNITGTGIVQIAGGAVTLTGSNSYTGDTYVYNQVVVSNDGNLGTGDIVLQGIITFNSSYTSTLNFPLVLGGTFDTNGNTVTLSGAVENQTGTTGSLVKFGAGTLILTGNNTYTGSTVIDAGTLQVGNGGTTGNISAANVINNGALEFDRSDTVTFSNIISGSGNITQAGTGTLILTGASSYGGTTTINSGATLQVGNGGSSGTLGIGNVVNNGSLIFDIAATVNVSNPIAGSGSVTVGGNDLLVLRGNNTYTGGTTINAGSALQIALGDTSGAITGNVLDNGVLSFNRSDSITFSGNITGSGQLTQGGGAQGLLTLTGSNSYTGFTNVEGGRLAISSDGNIGPNDVILIGGTIVADASFTSTHNYQVLAGNGGLFDTNGNTLTLSGVVEDYTGGGRGGPTKLGSGTLILTGANTYTNVTTITAGTLQIGNGGTSGTLAPTQLTAFAFITDNGVLAFDHSDNISNFLISGTGSVVQLGSGTLTLNGNDTYSGGTTIAATSTLKAGSTSAFGSGPMTVTGTLDLNGFSNSVASLSGGQSGTVTNTGASAATLTTGNGTSTIFSGTLQDGASALGLTVTGTNTNLILTGSNSYSGTTTIANGAILQVGNGGAAGAIVGNVTDNGTLTFNRLDTVTFPGVISGTGSVSQSGSGTLILTGADGYTGGTTVSSGTLQLGAGGSLASTGALTVNGGIFDLNGNTQTVGALSGTGGGITLGSGNLTASSSANTSLAAVISGSGSLTKAGSGTLTLTGVNTYTGTTTISAGTLALSGSGSIANSSVVQLNEWIFDISATTNGATVQALSGIGPIILGSKTLTIANNTPPLDSSSVRSGFSGSGGVTIASGSQYLVVAGYSGPTIIDSGATLGISYYGLGTTGSSDAVVNGTFDLNGMGAAVKSLTGSGTVEGESALTITTPQYYGTIGTLTIANASGTFSGAIGSTEYRANLTIAGGTQTLTGSSNLNLVTTNPGATLAMAGAASLAPSANGYSQNEVFDNGTFDISAAASPITIGILRGSGSVVLGSNTLVLANAITVGNPLGGTVPFGTIFSGVISGTGGVTLLSGVGGLGSNLILTGSNSYSGTTTIQPNSTLQLTSGGSIANSAVADAGMLQLGGDSSVRSLSGSGVVALGSNALTLTNANDTFSGTISGTGSLELATGFETLSGANSYTGVTTISSGSTLQIIGAGTLGSPAGATIISGGTLDLGGTTQTQNGGLTLSGGTLQNGTFSSSGTFALQSGTVSAALTGTGGAIKTTSGLVVLAGTNSYTGGTTVSAGTLSVTGSLTGPVTVSGGQLGGTGKVGATTVASGGTLTPGSIAAPGTLTIAGNLALASGSNFVNAVTPTAAGLASVTGTASVNGNALANFASGTYPSSQQYTLITAGGGVSGTFASFATTGLPASLRANLSYDADDVYLNLKPNALAPLLGGNVTTNQHNVVSAIDAVVTSGAAVPTAGFNALYNLSGAALNGAIDQISGQVGPNVSNAVGQSFLSFLAVTAGGGAGDAGSYAPGSAYGAAAAPHRAQLDAGETRVWGAGYGGHVSLSGDAASGAAALSASNLGLIGGADIRLDEHFLAGVTLDWDRQNFNSGNGSGISNDYALGIYGRADIDAAYVTAALGYGWHQITTLRVVNVSGTDLLQGKQNADDFGGRIETGWRIALDDTYAIAPYLAFAGESFESPAYAETALSGSATFALAYGAHTDTLGRSELGTHLDRSYALGNGGLTVDVRAAWAHQLDSLPYTQASFESLTAASFQVLGVRPARDTALLGADLELQYTSGLYLGLKGEGQFGAGTTILEGLGSFGLRW